MTIILGYCIIMTIINIYSKQKQIQIVLRKVLRVSIIIISIIQQKKLYFLIKNILGKCSINFKSQPNSIIKIYIFQILININKYQFIVIVNSGTIKNLILLSLANPKKFSIQKKKDIYNLMVIDKYLLLSKNRKIGEEIKSLPVFTL